MSDSRLRHVAGVLGRLTASEAARTLGFEGHLAGAEPVDRDRQRARAIRRTMEELGPFYVKVGQMLSTRPDMVSPVMIEEFQNLHEDVAIAPFADFEPVLEEQLGADWRRYFSDIVSDEPLGAASLAQVYRVTLQDGRPAVVKIQRPGVATVMLADMALLRRAARLVAKRAPDFNEIVDIEASLETVFQAMEPELDFTQEARNMDAARPLITRYPTLAVPEVIFVTPKVLVQSLAAGRSIRDGDRGAFAEDERLAIGRDLLGFMYRGYFVDRVFHADPHAGNVFVEPGQPATIIDWGMVGRLDKRMALAIVMVILNLAQNDGAGVAKAWIEMGRATPQANIPAFINDLSSFVPTIAGASLEDLNFGVSLTQILRLASRRGIQTSPTIALLGKSFANIEGSIRHLTPELQLLEVFQAEFQEIVFDLVTEAFSEEQAARITMELLIGTLAAPEQARSITRDLANRELTLNVKQSLGRSVEDRADARWRSLQRSATVVAAIALWLDHRRRDRR